jgi:hypothetical protein
MKAGCLTKITGLNGCWMPAVVFGFLSGAVQAATVVWQEPVSGSFNSAQNMVGSNWPNLLAEHHPALEARRAHAQPQESCRRLRIVA